MGEGFTSQSRRTGPALQTLDVLLRGGLSCCSLPPRQTLMALFKIQRHTCFEIWLSSLSLIHTILYFSWPNRGKETWQLGGSKQRETITQTHWQAHLNPEWGSLYQLVTRSVKCEKCVRKLVRLCELTVQIQREGENLVDYNVILNCKYNRCYH